MKGVYRNGELRGPLPLCVGVDVGGTWVRVAASRGQSRIRTIVTPADRDLRRLAPLLRAVWQRRRWRRGDIAALVVASRALWTRRERRALAHALRGLAVRVEVIADAQAALLGASGDGPGGGGGPGAWGASPRGLGGERPREPLVPVRPDPRRRAPGRAGALARPRRAPR